MEYLSSVIHQHQGSTSHYIFFSGLFPNDWNSTVDSHTFGLEAHPQNSLGDKTWALNLGGESVSPPRAERGLHKDVNEKSTKHLENRGGWKKVRGKKTASWQVSTCLIMPKSFLFKSIWFWPVLATIEWWSWVFAKYTCNMSRHPSNCHDQPWTKCI